MTVSAFAIVFLAYVTPQGVVLDRQVSAPMPAASCEAAIAHPAVRASYAALTDPAGRQAVLICLSLTNR
jgi:hypothetical protein